MALGLNPAIQDILFPSSHTHVGSHQNLFIRELYHAALDLIYPPHCASCGEALPAGANKAICLSCSELSHWIGDNRCQRCGDAVGQGSGVTPECPSCRTYPPHFLHGVCAVARYADGPLRDLILGLKFGSKIHIAKPLGELIAMRVRATHLVVPGTVLVPTPLTHSAAARRGFNQAHELALSVSKCLGLPVEHRLLKKIRSTAPQATLSRKKRRMNLKGAFACNMKISARYKDYCVLLIDDVITTGSTISECARTLGEAGIREVRAAAVARG